MFERIEAKDEEVIERADIQTLYAIKETQPFTSADIFKFLETGSVGADEDPGTAELRRICTSPKAKAPSAKSTGHALKRIVDAPVAVTGNIYVLKSRLDPHSKIREFRVAKLKKEE